MKKVLLALLTVLCLALPAAAAVQNFEAMSVDVPSGWTSQEQGPVVMLLSDDMTNVVTIAVTPAEGQSAKDIAAATAEAMSAKAPVAEGDGYKFDFSMQGQNGTMYIATKDNKVVIVTMIGSDSALMNIAKSVTPK